MKIRNLKKFSFLLSTLPHDIRLNKREVSVPTQQKCPQQWGGAAVLLFLVTEGVEAIMEKICKNCQYFVQGSVSSPEYIWGDCMKPGKYVPDARDNKKHGIFTWADKTCSDFKPRQDPN